MVLAGFTISALPVCSSAAVGSHVFTRHAECPAFARDKVMLVFVLIRTRGTRAT